MGNKRITEGDFWICSEGNIPTQFQGTFLRQKKSNGKIYIVKEDKATVGCIDFGCKKYSILIAIAVAATVVVLAVIGVLTVATGGAALIALGALAGAVGAGIGSVVGGLLCGQKMASKRQWIEIQKEHQTLFQGHPQVTGDWTMTCPIGGVISFAPNIKSWGQAIALASAGYISDILEGMTKGALAGLTGSAFVGIGSLGTVFSGGGSAIAGNVGRSALQGLGRIGTNLAEGVFLDLGSKSVEASANVLEKYGQSGNWNVVGDFATGYADSSLEDLNALKNIATTGGKYSDWEAAVMLLAPGSGGKSKTNNTNGSHSNSVNGNSRENNNSENTINENENSVKSNTNNENRNSQTAKKGEAFEAEPIKTKNWKTHEKKVTDNIKSLNPDATFGTEITLIVEGIDANGKAFKKRIRVDSLHQTKSGAYQLTDAKFSEVNDLTKYTNSQLRNTFTHNQKSAYDAIGGKDGAKVTKVTPVGGNAKNMGLKTGELIQVEPNINIGVNNSDGGITYRDYP